MLTITYTWQMQSSEEPEKTWNYRTTVVINDETDQVAVPNGIIDIASAVKPHCDNCAMQPRCVKEIASLSGNGGVLFVKKLTSCSAFKPKEQK